MAPPEGTAVCTACVGEPAQEAAPAPSGKASSLYEVPLTAQGSGHRTEVAAGGFAVVLDAGRALGGQESGPSPVQAFVSSIVGCSQVRGYAVMFGCRPMPAWQCRATHVSAAANRCCWRSAVPAPHLVIHLTCHNVFFTLTRADHTPASGARRRRAAGRHLLGSAWRV